MKSSFRHSVSAMQSPIYKSRLGCFDRRKDIYLLKTANFRTLLTNSLSKMYSSKIGPDCPILAFQIKMTIISNLPGLLKFLFQRCHFKSGGMARGLHLNQTSLRKNAKYAKNGFKCTPHHNLISAEVGPMFI